MTQAFPAQAGGYQIDFLFQGYPGKSVENGGLGWSTVVLLRGHGRVALIDTGSFGLRTALKQRLAALGVGFEDVTDLLLTHTHWDHIVNYPLFRSAHIHVGKIDLDWANSGDASVYAVPELYARELSREANLRYLDVGHEVLPGITVAFGPGHTPGHLMFILRGEERDILFVQDAAKSRAELVSLETDLSVDHAASRATLQKIWSLWRQREGSIVVPGHDLPLVLEGSAIQTIGERRAGIIGFLGNSLDDPTIFPLVR